MRQTGVKMMMTGVCAIKEGKLICEFCKVIDGGVGGTGKKCVMFVMSEGDK